MAHRVVPQDGQELAAELRVLHPDPDAAEILCERRWSDVGHAAALRDVQMAAATVVRPALRDADAGIWAARELLRPAVSSPPPVWSALHAPAALETMDSEAAPDKRDVDRFAV